MNIKLRIFYTTALDLIHLRAILLRDYSFISYYHKLAYWWT